MIVLNSVNQSLVLSLKNSSSIPLPIYVSSSDKAGNKLTNLTLSNNLEDVVICPNPAASSYKEIENITVFNPNGAEVTVIISILLNTTYYQKIQITLQEKDTLEYTQEGWQVINKNGEKKTTVEDSILNESLYDKTFGYTGDNLTTIEFTRISDGFSFTKTLTYDGNDNLISIDIT